jgi:hypothetical protein
MPIQKNSSPSRSGRVGTCAGVGSGLDRSNSVNTNSVSTNNVNNHILTSTRARRAAAMLCAALAGLGMARGAVAQAPQTGSPGSPTPYQSSLFHAGGSDPALVLSSPPFGLSDRDPLNPLLLNPLYGQLQGTPTALVPGIGPNAGSFIPVQIPSFDLGAYNPDFAPGQNGPTGFYPDHLADGSVYSWQAPFHYVPLTVGRVVVDDSSPAPTPAAGTTPATSGFALTVNPGNWENQATGNAAGTATSGEYDRLQQGVDGAAVWTLVATTPGSFSVYLHIPDQLEDSTGVIEPRSTQVTYQITTTGANASTTTATVSQTEANSSQFLAGPFLLAVGDTVTVTLQRDNFHNQNTNRDPNGNGQVLQDYIVADSMTLQTAIGDVRSSPTAINTSAYPADFARVKYWGIFVPTDPAKPVPVQAGIDPTQNALPDTTGGKTPNGTPLYFYGDPAKTENDTGALDGPFPAPPAVPTVSHKRLIRQLVYFGRQDPTFSNGNTVDDQDGPPTATKSGFTTSGFGQVSDTTGTATRGRYSTATPASAVSAGGGSTATWSFIAPNGGDYYATVHLPQTPPVTTGTAQKRITDATYTVTYPAGTQTVKISQAQTGDVTLPTGAIPLNRGDRVTVTLTAITGLTNSGAYTVVADSVRIATSGNGTGAIYCVDGFTGGVVWRFQTPGGLNGPSAPVFSSPVVTKINVLVTPPVGATPAVYQNKLVVIVGDDNGMVYCLDAVGNGDGTSNSRAIDPVSGLPIYIPQPTYNTPTPPTQVDQPGYLDANGFGHIGTTGAYWIYRPDLNNPKYLTDDMKAGVKRGQVKRRDPSLPRQDTGRNPVLTDPNNDLPIPAAFGTASPNVFINPLVSTKADAATGSIPLNPDGSAPSNAKVYVGNSNGVLYALDGAGVPIDGTDPVKYAASGDQFNASYDLRVNPTVFPATATDAVVPTPQPLWWFTLRGADANSDNNPSNADIESAPALYTTVTATSVTVTGPPPVTTTTFAYAPTVYIGSAHEVESTSNVGRLYALNGTYGPAGNSGLADPSAQPDPTKPGYTGPGSLNYNIGQRAQINKGDTADWSFPDAYDRTTTNATKDNQGQSTNKLPRPALGNITGSPVVFTDTNENNAARRTRVYIAANVGLEVPPGGNSAAARPDDTETGRLWAVNLDGSVGRTTNTNAPATDQTTVWAYPQANDPNNADATLSKTPEPSPPLGAFLRATPAMGFVQFPQFIKNGDASDYVHTDAVPGAINSKSVPMLYVATRGVNDTALYAVDVDGGSDDQRLIYREASPDSSIFQSSPVLIANASKQGGNGGAVYAVTNNTLYDFSATPISNPGIVDPATGQTQTFPLIRKNKAYTGFGPISSPAVAAADVTDSTDLVALRAAHPTSNYTANETDWIYVGDGSTGFCRGITPYDITDAGIPFTFLNTLVPPTADSPSAVDLTASLQVYLVDSDHANSTRADVNADALKVGGPLPVYDWGQNVYIRIANVVLPGTNQKTYVSNKSPAGQTGGPITYYGDGGPVEFDLSDSTDGTPPDHATVPAILVTAPALATQPIPNGFIARTDKASGNYMDTNLVTATGDRYIGAYTYVISDGTARRNTPGSRRRVLNAKQVVHTYVSDGNGGFTLTGTATLVALVSNGNAVSTQITGPNGTVTNAPTLTAVPPVDQPTFGILNPLAVRAGGIPLQLNPGVTPQNAVTIGDDVGPFRAVQSPISNTTFDLEALANGNNILQVTPQGPPTSTSGGGTDPTRRRTLATNPLTTPHVVVTSTGLISHNTSGDNLDRPDPTNPNSAFLPTGSYNGGANEGIAGSFGSLSVPYAMDVADRSALGLRRYGVFATRRLRVKTGTISGGGAGLYWNDNSVPTRGHDHDSVVNFLPWESAPVGYKVGANPSIDYPDVGPSDIAATLHRYSGGSADLTLGNAIAEPANFDGGTDQVLNRRVYANPVQFQISIPHFQPANQQVYQRPASAQGYGDGFETAPVDPNGNPLIGAPLVFPMGYVTTRRIYVPDQNGFYRPGAAYRDVRVYTGVPPDYNTQMGDATADVGRVPSGFGIQTSNFAPLTSTYPTAYANPPGTFDPYRTFSPYNPMFQDYFRPLKIYNAGNVNLLNVHLDQKQNDNGKFVPLEMVSDALDKTSSILSYDLNSALTGARFGRFGLNNEPEDSYLIRSSLDGDLVAAYGHNPYIIKDPNTGLSHLDVYPGATFHKAQVGSGQPSTLFVPDSPEGFTPGASLDVPPTNHPTQEADTNNNSLPFKTAPFVGVAIPFGTPVGSYHGNLQLFEGLDSGGYGIAAANANPSGVPPGDFAGLTAQIYPPQYGKAVGGIGTPTAPGNTPNNRPQDTIEFVPGGGSEVSLMPNSPKPTVLNVRVIEDRMTDGATFGAVPMIDALGAGPKDANKNPTSVPDFAPAAFRDPSSGNLSVYWTSGRVNPGYGIYSATVPMLAGAFMPVDPTTPGSATAPNYVNEWWTSLGNAANGYNGNGTLKPAIPTNLGTNSGLTIAQDAQNLARIYAFTVNVQAPPMPGVTAYQNTLLGYTVDPKTGRLETPPLQITNDPTQVKYGVKGLVTDATLTKFTRNLWAFWTATTRGRTAVYYNSADPATGGAWVPNPGVNAPSTIGLLPIPAGLTAVADAAPLLTYGNVLDNGTPTLQATIEVTYSGTAPDGSVDLYQSRYQPDAKKAALLDLVAFPAVTEILMATGQPGGWSQARDVAWSRTSPLNLLVKYSNNGLRIAPLLYDSAGKPLFSRAVFDKATGLLVLTGVPVPDELPDRAGSTSHTVYVDYATGRVRFSPALRSTTAALMSQTYEVRALFSPLARRITTDSRADTAPTTFLDGTLKANTVGSPVKADRRWYIWRKSGGAGAASSATIYYKTQRLTAFLEYPIDLSKSFSITLNGAGYSGPVDAYNVPPVLNTDRSVRYPASGRLYFPIQSGAEGKAFTVSYTDTGGTSRIWPAAPATDTVQWQDELRSNDTAVPPTDATAGLAAINPGYTLPLDNPVNENNVAAFLDPLASLNTEHKVWLFWNSTRNGTADLYYETINPLFTAGP